MALDTWWCGCPHSSQQAHHAIEPGSSEGWLCCFLAPPSSAQEGTVLDDNLGFVVQRPKFKVGGSLMVIQVDCPGTLSFSSVSHSSAGDKELQHVLCPPSPSVNVVPALSPSQLCEGGCGCRPTPAPHRALRGPGTFNPRPTGQSAFSLLHTRDTALCLSDTVQGLETALRLASFLCQVGAGSLWRQGGPDGGTFLQR